MVSTEIKKASLALKTLISQVAPEQAEVIRLVRRVLTDCADQTAEMESSWPVPGQKLVDG